MGALAERLDERRIELERQRDSRCVFTCAYVLITRRLARGLGSAGYEDPAWVVQLAETFAGLYFKALDESAAASRGEPGIVSSTRSTASTRPFSRHSFSR